MKRARKLFSALILLALLLALATPAYAFDGRTGDNIVIAEGQVIDDDLYIAAQTFTLDGTVKGDLVVGARTVIINGTVEGDLIVGAQTAIINGSVADNVRVLVAAVQLGKDAKVGGDLIAMGASVEAQTGSSVGRDLVTGSAQALLAGDVGRNVLAGTSALEIRGPVSGNVQAYVNADRNTASAPPMNFYMRDIPLTIPSVKPGLTLSPGARIAGNLQYSSSVDLPIPSNVVQGQVSRVQVVSERREFQPRTPTNAERVGRWVFGLLRTMVTLILFGLLFTWLFPRFMRALPENLRGQPLVSLGWGAVAYAAAFFSVLAIVLVTIFLAIAGLRWNIFWLGWLALTAVGVAFFLASSYLTKVVVGDAVGKWILQHTNPSLSTHRIWPMVIGIVALVLVIGLLRFPLLPFGFFGWLLNFVVILFGLGALWIWGQRAWASRHAAPSQP